MIEIEIPTYLRYQVGFLLLTPSLTLPGLARRSDEPSAALPSGRRPQGGRWEEAAHRQGNSPLFLPVFLHF
eukprot:1179719-Prorocentrum_minimum.AAC.4